MHGLECAIFQSWHAIWLESDSIFMVCLLSSHSVSVSWKYQARWSLCLEFILSIDLCVSHIFQEENRVAYLLSKRALDVSQSVWWSILPSFCTRVHHEDILGRKAYRFCN